MRGLFARLSGAGEHELATSAIGIDGTANDVPALLVALPLVDEDRSLASGESRGIGTDDLELTGLVEGIHGPCPHRRSRGLPDALRPLDRDGREVTELVKLVLDHPP